ncbi:MAG: hypothetical protein ACLT98_15780 [Eggerthellaceae bacterium]
MKIVTAEAELPHYDEKRYPNERTTPAGGITATTSASGVDYRRAVPTLEPRVRGDQARPAIVVSRTHPDFIAACSSSRFRNLRRHGGGQVYRPRAWRSFQGRRGKPRKQPDRGACVGPKGSRVRMVVEELQQRVDVTSGTRPREIRCPGSSLACDPRAHRRRESLRHRVVPDDQLSLAIGGGQNARLAARLTNWHIDIKSASSESSRHPK